MLMISVVGSTSFGMPKPSFSGTDPPYDIHLSWQNDSSTTMTVVWETSPTTMSSTVKYGPDANYGFSKEGIVDDQGTNGLIHIVEITGLSPGTTYHYTCGEDIAGWSPDSTFKTAPTGPADFVFCSMGDSRNNSAEFSQIVSKVVVANPTFTVFVGDLCYSDNASLYDTWFSNWQQLGDHSPIAPCIGNHEGAATNYLHRFALPNSERWYSFNYSNMHIIVLSTSMDTYQQGSIQYQWLINDLTTAANDTYHPWKIVTFHNPPYNAGAHGGDPDVQGTLASLFSIYQIDLVFNGHNHFYERTYPLKGGGGTPVVTNTSLHYYRNPDGVVYATTGSCGAPLADVEPAYYLAVALKTYNYAIIHVFSNNSLHLQTFLDNGVTVIDDFWIDKTDHAPVGEISGPSWGVTHTNLTYQVNMTDPENDTVSCQLDWGDGNITCWFGPYPSGSAIVLTHSWSQTGSYPIRMKLKDFHSQETGWSSSLTVAIHGLVRMAMMGTYSNWTESNGFVSIKAVSIWTLHFHPFELTHHRSETMMFSQDYTGKKTPRFIIGVFNIVN